MFSYNVIKAIIEKRNRGYNKRLMQFRLKDPEPLLYHNESILRDGEITGYLTSENYGHHLEFKESGLTLDDIKNMVNNKRACYDFHVDMKSSKWTGTQKLQKCELPELPKYLINNKDKYSIWLE